MEQQTENTATKSKFSMKGKLAFLKNKYLLAGLLFLVWMVFFDPKDIGSGINRWRKYKELQASEQKMMKKIDETEAELGQLKNNARTIEKYAREKYWMKKDNEDLFIIGNEAENK